jgi:hypothetical protein
MLGSQGIIARWDEVSTTIDEKSDGVARCEGFNLDEGSRNSMTSAAGVLSLKESKRGHHIPRIRQADSFMNDVHKMLYQGTI